MFILIPLRLSTGRSISLDVAQPRRLGGLTNGVSQLKGAAI